MTAMDFSIILFQIIVLVFSVVIHEVSHGFVANELGDPTAKNAGRLTLNPLKHLDPFGSVILPLLMAILPGGIIFGWAKPVPYNPYNLKDPKKGAAFIAAAGPVSNFLTAGIFALVYRLAQGNLAFEPLLPFLGVVVVINIVLGVFNLVPIPPLDGSKILFSVLPVRFLPFMQSLERYGMLILVFFIFFGISIISPIISFLARLLLG